MDDLKRVRISSYAREAISAEVEKLLFPPDPYATRLHEAVATHHSVSKMNVIVGCGSTEGMYALASLAPKGIKVVCSTPSFPLYQMLAESFELELEKVFLNAYKHDFSVLENGEYADGSIIFIDSPLYITGTASDWGSIFSLARKLKYVTVVYDNTYGEYDEDNPDKYFAEALSELDNLLITRTFSKAHGLLGLRVGYLLGNNALIGRLRQRIMPYSVNSLAIQAALASLNDKDNIERNIWLNELAKKLAYRQLNKMSVKYVPTKSNALLMDFGEDYSMVNETAVRMGLKFRDEKKCGYKNHIQIHLIDPVTVTPFLDMLTELMESIHGKQN